MKVLLSRSEANAVTPNKKTDIVFFYTCEVCDEHWIQPLDDIMCDESELDISTVIEDDELITKFIDAYGVCECCEMEEDYWNPDKYWDEVEDREEIDAWEQMQQKIGY